MRMIEQFHQHWIRDRRANRLVELLLPLLPKSGRVLDVGCGDGWIAARLQERRPSLRFYGIEVLPRGDGAIPTEHFDGRRIPYENGSFDAVMLIDVLHHADDATLLLRECQRVSRRSLLIKDHLREGWLAEATLAFMDRVGNQRHGVTLPYNYWRRAEWSSVFRQLDLRVQHWSERLDLYFWPASLFFERSLHFLSRLAVCSETAPQLQPALESLR